jgi:hypothetical protein
MWLTGLRCLIDSFKLLCLRVFIYLASKVQQLSIINIDTHMHRVCQSRLRVEPTTHSTRQRLCERGGKESYRANLVARPEVRTSNTVSRP